jgi:hypothetical protein
LLIEDPKEKWGKAEKTESGKSTLKERGGFKDI